MIITVKSGKIIQNAYRVVSGSNKSTIEINEKYQGEFGNGETATHIKKLKNQIVNPATFDVNNLSLKIGEQSVLLPSAIVIDNSTIKLYMIKHKK